MIERLNGRRSVAISIGGLLLVVLVGWLGFVSPQRSKAAELQVTIQQKELELATAQAIVRGPLLRRSTAELATLRKAIPDAARMSQILRQLSHDSRDARVRLLGITPQPVTSIGGADVLGLSVTVEGRYFGIREFLRLLRSRADIKADKVHAKGRLFAVDQIQFSGTNGERRGLIQATLTINAFAFSQPVAVSSAPDGTASAETGSEAASP